jgi:hypothetical protein
MGFNAPGPMFGSPLGMSATTSAPLVVVFERDDAIAVPLLSQLRLAGYDVRAARTPVELFDTAQKHAVALMLVDLGNAAASRREFWVALDAQRRGRSIQVVTYRLATADALADMEMDASANALPDVELNGPHDLQLLLDTVRQRVPLHGAPAGGPLGLGTLDGYQPPSSPFGQDGAGCVNGYAPLGTGANMHGPGLDGPIGDTFGFGGLGQAPPAPAFAPLGMPPGASSSQIPMPPGQLGSSPFAHPAAENPFTGTSNSPFDKALTDNPFAASDTGFGKSTAYGPGAFAPGGNGLGENRNGHRAGFGAGEGAVADAWVPPSTGGLNGDAAAPTARGPVRPLVRNDLAAAARSTTRPADQDMSADEHGFPTYDIALQQDAFARDDPRLRDATAPVSALLPAVPGALNGQAERALGTVLVEGALISPRKLEVLKDIQRMLAGVDMDFKLGELALLFKFLSPDQLLAALLVSRGIVSPQQIAGLGRIKQELGASGMDYDLETLLIMFHVLPAEEIRALRRELA